MITLNNIYKNYTTESHAIAALTDISLQVKKGNIYGIIGKSGAGKSTLIRTVNLLERPSRGQVFVDGIELTSLNAEALRQERHHIGMIFQHFNLLNSRTVFDNIAFPLEISGLSKKEMHSIVNPLLELTGLTSKKNAYPPQLSGGQKQRVAIARALASKPKVLLSDEATSSLDPETTLSILQLLKNIRDQLQLTILLITHEMTVIKACCDEVSILDQGKIIESGEVGEFFSHPKTAIAKNFIASSLPQHLPQNIERYLLTEETADTHPVLRIWFLGKSATQPIISQLINQFNLRVNILQANVETIKNHVMGIMMVAIDGLKENQQAALQYLTTIGVTTEVLGHVPANIITFN